MSKSAIAFLDHPFHRKTRSSNFFVDILANDFDVHVYYIDDDPRALMQEIAAAGYDIAVCWQTEFCAPYLLMRGMRVICIPMYDGVANAPDWYWLAMRQARFFNFSKKLHLHLKTLSIETYHFKYYNPSKIDVPQATFEGLRGFFWQRRPEEGLSWKFAHDLIGASLTSLHIHNAPDTADPADWLPNPLCTVSQFTEDGAPYRAALDRANLFLCPRFTEGIGMAMLEAMARGMCVIAHDAPTANEYIVDGLDGLLLDYGNETQSKMRLIRKSVLTPALAEKMGKAARAAYLRGCEEWKRDSAQIPFFVRSAPVADLSAREKAFAPAYLEACRYARRDFGHYLHKLFKLHCKGLMGEEASAVRLRDQVKWRAKRIPGARFGWRILKKLQHW